MRKVVFFITTLIFVVIMATGCFNSEPIPDGRYTARLEGYDANGYQDFVTLVYQDGVVVEMEADAVHVSTGQYKSQDVSLRAAMEAGLGTYPEKYYRALINQYMSHFKASEVEIVAGATTSSNNFIKLLKELERSLKAGNTDPEIIVPR